MLVFQESKPLGNQLIDKGYSDPVIENSFAKAIHSAWTDPLGKSKKEPEFQVSCVLTKSWKNCKSALGNIDTF